MEIEGWTQTLDAPTLLWIAAAAVAVLLVMIMAFRVHAFVALIVVSLLTAVATGIPTKDVVPTLIGSFGTTLGTVALLVGLGAMLGRIIETSGGAKVLADKLVDIFGEKRAPFALGVASLLFGFPIFFDAGLVVMLPVVFAVARRLGGGVLRYGLPAAGAFSVMHVFVPPHPGPVSAATFFEANVGLLTLVALAVAIPTWYVTSYLFGQWIGKKIELPVPAILGEADQEALDNPPKFGTVMAILLLPLTLIFINTGLNTLAQGDSIDAQNSTWITDFKETWAFDALRALGETPVALTITLIVAMFAFGIIRGVGKADLERVMDSALGPIASVVLITGAGGMFGGVLRTSGIGGALEDSLAGIGLPLIVSVFLVSAILRVAQGSATVALTTTAGLFTAAVVGGNYNELQVVALVIAVAAGSVIASHVNDSGFWLVGKFMGMSVRDTLRTWTVMETLIALMGFALSVGIFAIASL